MLKIFLTRRIPEAGIRLLEPYGAVDIFPGQEPITKEALLSGVRDADALLCLLTDRIDAAILENAPRLKVIATYAVGVDNIDLEAARKHGIIVTNTPGVLTDATADLAFALILAAGRSIAAADRWMRANDFPGWAPMQFLGVDFFGKTLGIIGAGRIGQALAQRARGAYGMDILYHNRQRDSEFEQANAARWVAMDDLLRESDFISLHVPLTGETTHMIGEREFGLMKPSAVLINTARGPVVDEQALIRALREHRILAAGVDVYEYEPHIPEQMKSLDNLILLPHIGSATTQTREKMAVMAARNILAVLEGEEPPNRVH